MLIYMIMSVLLLLSTVYAIRAVFVARRVTGEAREDYAYRQKNEMIDPNITEDSFIKAFKRCHGARGSVYGALTLLAAAVLTPAMLGAISYGYDFLWRISGQDRAFEPGYLVWQFILFGSIIAGWALIGYIGARRYYKNMPGPLEAEIGLQAKR